MQLQQLFSNLIFNSLKFCDKKPVIEISWKEYPNGNERLLSTLKTSKKYVHLIFKDNGIGFDQQYAEQIFVIFQRLNHRQAYERTGIGLALCKKIVENHHGVITALGELEKGATFNVYLPY